MFFSNLFMENKNIEIIGAGLSGLLLAYYIFKNTNKFNVTVYEKNSSTHKNKNFCFWLEKNKNFENDLITLAKELDDLEYQDQKKFIKKILEDQELQSFKNLTLSFKELLKQVHQQQILFQKNKHLEMLLQLLVFQQRQLNRNLKISGTQVFWVQVHTHK